MYVVSFPVAGSSLTIRLFRLPVNQTIPFSTTRLCGFVPGAIS